MAQVDFTNAVLSLVSTNTEVPTHYTYMALRDYLYDSSGNSVSTGTSSILQSAQKSFIKSWSGIFNTSGTEFYIRNDATNALRWKISNISFSQGDTYVFQIPVTLTCN